jgi:hypothetical protein
MGNRRVNTVWVYEQFQSLGWKGTKTSIRKTMYKGVDLGMLRRVGGGLYELTTK